MVRLIQLLCPERHAIAALLYDPANTSAQEALDQLIVGLVEMRVNRWCGICGSQDLRLEDKQTDFEHLKDAQAWADAVKVLNQVSRMVLDRHGLTYDSWREKLNN